jgi:hypothetical protein
VTLRETTPGVYTATVPARATGSYGITLDLPAALGGRRRVLVDVPYPAEYRPSATGAALLAQVAEQTGGHVLAASGSPVLARAARSWRTPLTAAALVLLALSLALRLIGRRASRGRPPAPPAPEKSGAAAAEELSPRA